MTEARPTLLAVHAHPDDESSSTGGILARYSRAGVRTVLVTCTRGEVGEISDPNLARPENLAEVRERELAEAIRILGVSRAENLGYRDSGMAGTADNNHPASFQQTNFEEATRRLVRIVREERPWVMVTYDENGGYGHPDHIRAHQVASAAFHLSGDPARFPDLGAPWNPSKLYYTAWPRSQIAAFVRAIQEAGLELPGERPTPAEDEAPPEFGTPDELITTEIDVSDCWEIKWAALTAHKTQIGPESFFLRLPREGMREMWSREYFQLAVGPHGAAPDSRETDLFAGLRD